MLTFFGRPLYQYSPFHKAEYFPEDSGVELVPWVVVARADLDARECRTFINAQSWLRTVKLEPRDNNFVV